MKFRGIDFLRRTVGIVFLMSLFFKMLHFPFSDALFLISGVLGVILFYPKINSLFRRLESQNRPE
jgi:hypothetical protein